MNTGFLDEIQRRAFLLQLKEAGIELPENPTLGDIKLAVCDFIANVKEVQNTDPWSDEDWRKMSRTLQAMEELVSKL